MTPTTHVTDEQMYELLQPNASELPHLQICPECQAEVSILRQSVANFRSAATGFAAVEALKHPPLAARGSSWFFGPKVWAASFATAAAVLAVSISMLHPVHNSTGTQPSRSGSAPQAALTTESDDALLEGIQRDLSTSIPPSLEPLAVPAASSGTSTQN